MGDVESRAFQAAAGSVGMLGNFVVCLVIAKVSFMHTITNAFIFNQALVDFIGSLMTLLLGVLRDPDPIPGGLRGAIFCSVWKNDFIRWAPYVTSSFNLVVLTLERYLAIVFPYKYQRWVSRQRALALIVAVWVVGFGWESRTIFVHSYVDGGCVLHDFRNPRAVGLSVIAVDFVVPVSVMAFCYAHMAVVLKRAARRVGPALSAPNTIATSSGNSAPTAQEGQGDSLMRARRNVFKTLCIVTVIFALCWSPAQLIFFAYNMGVEVDFYHPVLMTRMGIVAINLFINPFIYAIKYKQFQKALKVFFGRVRGQ